VDLRGREQELDHGVCQHNGGASVAGGLSTVERTYIGPIVFKLGLDCGIICPTAERASLVALMIERASPWANCVPLVSGETQNFPLFFLELILFQAARRRAGVPAGAAGADQAAAVPAVGGRRAPQRRPPRAGQPAGTTCWVP